MGNMKQDYDRDFEELFETNGWKHVVRESEEEVESLKEQLASGDVDLKAVYFIKGRISQLRQISNLHLLFTDDSEGELYDATL